MQESRLQPHRHNQQGFTLIEALIALVVLSAGIFGLIELQARSMSGLGGTKTQSTAAHLAHQLIEELRVADYDSIVSGSDAISAMTGGNSDFTRTWTVTDFSSPAYKQVAVTVAWSRPEQQTESITLGTYIAQSAGIELAPIGEPSTPGAPNPPPAQPAPSDPAPDPDPGDVPDPELPVVEEPVWVTCSCFYQNRNQISLVSGGGCCSTSRCVSGAPPNIDNKTSFTVTCQLP